MSARVLVAHSYYLSLDPKQVRKMKPYPPLATLIAAAVLRDRGHAVALFDAMLAPGEHAFDAALDELAPEIVGILEDNFNFLTKMCTTRMRSAALAMIRSAKAAGCRVAVNGSDAHDHPAIYLAAGADAVIVGEAETTFAELVAGWEKNPESDLAAVAGLVLRAPGGRVRRTALRPVVDDIDTLPLPAWDLVDVAGYRAAWTQAHGRFSWNVVTSRGCPYGCNWCAKPLFGRRYGQRSAAKVAAEVAQLITDIAPDQLWFADDIFGLTPRWIEAYAAELAARGIRIPFTMQSRVNLMTPSAVRALKAAGCAEVWMGVESGAQRILDAMDKGSTVEQARDATRLLKEHRIRACWFLQLGYPGETWDDILLTRDLVRALEPDDVGVSVAYPLPGTEFYRRVEAQMRVKRNWTDSDDLAMLFEGTYRTSFYRRIRDLLHAEVEQGAAARASLDAAWRRLERSQDAYRSSNPVGALSGTPGVDERSVH